MNTIEAREKVSKMLWSIIYLTQKRQIQIAKELSINKATISQYITKAKTPTLQNYLKIQNMYETLRSTREDS